MTNDHYLFLHLLMITDNSSTLLSYGSAAVTVMFLQSSGGISRSWFESGISMVLAHGLLSNL
jgi:hypothetical protein